MDAMVAELNVRSRAIEGAAGCGWTQHARKGRGPARFRNRQVGRSDARRRDGLAVAMRKVAVATRSRFERATLELRRAAGHVCRAKDAL